MYIARRMEDWGNFIDQQRYRKGQTFKKEACFAEIVRTFIVNTSLVELAR